MHNSSSKISDLSMNIEEKKDIVARHMHMLENYCEEIFICYDILCNDVIEVVLKVIATDNDLLNLPTAYVANIDEEDVLYVDLFVDV